MSLHMGERPWRAFYGRTALKSIPWADGPAARQSIIWADGRGGGALITLIEDFSCRIATYIYHNAAEKRECACKRFGHTPDIRL